MKNFIPTCLGIIWLAILIYMIVIAFFPASAEARVVNLMPKRTVTIQHSFGYPYGITYIGPEPKVLYSPSIRLRYNRQLPDYKNIYVPSLRGPESLLDFYRTTPVPRYSR